MKMPTIVGIFIFISREIFVLSYGKKEFTIVSNFRFSWVEHEKSFLTSEPEHTVYNQVILHCCATHLAPFKHIDM